MKKILITIFALLFINAIYLNSYIFRDTKAQVIISVDNLLTTDIIKSLENDLNNYSDIEFIEGSLLTGIIVLQVIDDDLEISSLETVFNRWGCSIKNIDYRMLN